MGKRKIKLNENDLKNTLAMKKVKPPKTVLVNNITDYWPVLDEQHVTKFQGIIESFTSDNQNKQHIQIGLESTLRSIKNKSVKIIFISDEISPQWFGKHLISMSLAKEPSTKILILPKMKELTKKLLNVQSVIWCIKKEIASFSEFYSSLNTHDELLKHYYTVKPNVNVSVPKKKLKNMDDKEIPIVYLKKSSVAAFSVSNKSEKMEFEDSLDFISLAKYDDPSLLQKKAPVSLYRPLKVKKVIGNINRKFKNS